MSKYREHKSIYANNNEMLLAFQTVENGDHTFLSGQAGSAKTTGFIKGLDLYSKQHRIPLIPTAITGAAANVINQELNIPTSTLHSLFGDIGKEVLNLSAPDTHKRLSRSKKFIEYIEKLVCQAFTNRNRTMLLIEEVGMLHQRLFDAIIRIIIDILKKYSKKLGIPQKNIEKLVKNYIQIIGVGALDQLPTITKYHQYGNPIATNEDFDFENHCFVRSKYYDKCEFKHIQLKKNYRQISDPQFNEDLESIRCFPDDLGREVLTRINQRVTNKSPDICFREQRDQGNNAIIATPFTNQREIINNKLNPEEQEVTTYQRINTGLSKEYLKMLDKESNYQVKLQVWIGCNLILKINLDEGFYNGAIVTVIGYDSDNIVIEKNGITKNVSKHKYDVMYRESCGYVLQFPFLNGPANTIHSLQGITINSDQSIIIDWSGIDRDGKSIYNYNSDFITNMLYVALSRARSYQQIIICTPNGKPLSKKHFKINSEIRDFLEDLN